MTEPRPKKISEQVLTMIFAVATGAYAYAGAKAVAASGDYKTGMLFAGMSAVFAFAAGIIDYAPLRFEFFEDERARRRREMGWDRPSDSEKKKAEENRRAQAKEAYAFMTKCMAVVSLLAALAGGWHGYKEGAVADDAALQQSSPQEKAAPGQDEGGGEALRFRTPYMK